MDAYNVEFSMLEGSFNEFKEHMCKKLDIDKHAFESTIDNIDGNQFFDYITDLHWISNFEINITIHCANCNADLDSRIISYVTDMIQFWNNDAERCIVGGKRKKIKVCFIP